MKEMKLFVFLLSVNGLALLISCSSNDNIELAIDEPPNILFIIADDLGKDAINGFSEGSLKPTTPNIDAIRNKGLLFNNFWTYPTCTPTRSSIITGKYGLRTNVKSVGDDLAQSETVLQKYISDNSSNNYATGLVGKWHLSGNDVNPESFGIDYYAGLIRGAVSDYYQWQLFEDDVSTTETDYITEFFTDLSIDWIGKQSKPWFMWLAYNAPHTPFHAPPSNMHSQGNLPEYTDGVDPIPYYFAAIETMDFQIGRLLESLEESEKENTIIIFIGDNGTPNQVAQSPYTSSTVKNTLFQGGINTPMFISGKGVSRNGIDDNLITSTDLFSTIAQIAGVSATTIHDSKSFQSLFTQSSRIREFQYSELTDGGEDSWVISNGAYKLHVNANNIERMYDLINDPYEQVNLLIGTLTETESNAKTELEAELNAIRQ